MTYRLRQIIFFSAALLFIITAPFVLLRAQGYTLSWKQGLHLQKNGLILVDSIPSGAKIFLDGKDTNLKTPARLTSLPPGSYTIGLKLSGFLPWQNTISVEAKTATFADHILLLPEATETPLWLESPGLAAIALRHDGGLSAGWFRDNPSYLILKTLPSQTETTLALPSLPKGAEPKIIFSPNGDSILLLVSDKNQDLHPWVKILEAERPWQDLGQALPRPVTHISWAPDYDNALFFRTPNLTGHFFLASRTVVPLTTVPLQDVLIRPERLVFGRYVITSDTLKKTSSLWRRATFSSDLELISELPYSASWKLLDAPVPTLLAHDVQNNLIYYWSRESAKPRVYPGSGAALDPDGNALLVWHKNNLRVMFAKEARLPKEYRLNGSLQKVIWYPDHPIALLIGDQDITSLSVAPDSIPNQQPLYRDGKIITTVWSEGNRTLAVLSEREQKRSLILVHLPNP